MIHDVEEAVGIGGRSESGISGSGITVNNFL